MAYLQLCGHVKLGYVKYFTIEKLSHFTFKVLNLSWWLNLKGSFNTRD